MPLDVIHGLVTVTENVLRTRVKPPHANSFVIGTAVINTHGIVEDMCYERQRAEACVV